MDVAGLIDQLDADGALLAAAARRAGWDAAVPGTDWDVRTLVTHVGGVHRWAADAIRTSSTNYHSAAADAVGTGPGDDGLLEWFRTGHAELVAALRAAAEDLSTFTFLPADSAKHFWSRRQAHETAIHRIDAEGAAGEVTPVPAVFAQDGIGELLHGFAARKSNAISVDASLALRPTDQGARWRLTFGGERVVAEAGGDVGGADAAVVGTSSDLYRWLWNRPSAARVQGDGAVAALWAENVRVRWG